MLLAIERTRFASVTTELRFFCVVYTKCVATVATIGFIYLFIFFAQEIPAPVTLCSVVIDTCTHCGLLFF